MGSSVVASKGPNLVSENTECEHKKKCVDVKIVNNTDVVGINVHINDKAKHSARFIYNKCKAGDVESLLVRPLAYSFMIYRSALTDVSKCSYANIVKSKNRNPLSVKTKSAEVVHNKNKPSGSVGNKFSTKCNQVMVNSLLSNNGCENVKDNDHTDLNKKFKLVFDMVDHNNECDDVGVDVLDILHTEPKREIRPALDMTYQNNTDPSKKFRPVSHRSNQNKVGDCGGKVLGIVHTYPNKKSRTTFDRSVQSTAGVNGVGKALVGSVHTDLFRNFRPKVVTTDQNNESGMGDENVSGISHPYPNRNLKPVLHMSDQNRQGINDRGRGLGSVHTDLNRKLTPIVATAKSKQ